MSVKTITRITKEQVEMIPLANIINKFDVRVALDQDRVIQFAGMYEGGVNLPPVRLVRIDEENFAYIDGRHRGAARAYLNLPDVPAVIVNGNLRDNPVELYAQALEANWGGAKTLTREDITHTVLRMLELGATQKAVRDRLPFLPPGATNVYFANARSIIVKRRLSKALDAIRDDGTSLNDAAKKFGLKPELLKNVVSGKKGKWGVSRSNELQTATELKTYISRVLNTANSGIGGKLLRTVLPLVESGEMSVKVAEGIVKAYGEHIRRTGVRIRDWQARLASITSEQNKAVPAIEMAEDSSTVANGYDAE